MTRDEYMTADTITAGAYDGSKGHDFHEAYYGQYVNDWHIQVVLDRIGRERLLQSRDLYLNDIPLPAWDALPATRHMEEKAKEFGDFVTLAVKGCVYKAAARKWLAKNDGLPKWRIRYQYPSMSGDVVHQWLYSYAIGDSPADALCNYRTRNPGLAQMEIIDAEGNLM